MERLAEAMFGRQRELGELRAALRDAEAGRGALVLLVGEPGIMQAMWTAVDGMAEKFQSGDGHAWGDHHPCLFEGTERFFRSGYRGNLVASWLPALDGVVPKLERGAKVADVGCGLGASTILMALAFPKTRFFGYDSHPASIETARRRAAYRGPLADRRAVRGRQTRRQSQPDRPRLLLRVDHDLCAALPFTPRSGARRSSRRRAARPNHQRGRLLTLPPRDSNAVQPRARSRA